ncbi:MAG: helix-turn-helix transcriptional regulator [Lachnospiraceae bacterium]|nr:helix-turn-helix transcriptional regulator [Lachnospiraceae bacterium]
MSFSPYSHAVIHYIETHVKDGNVDYEEMEKQIGFSQVYIREVFRKHTGCSLGRYVRIRKICYSAFELLHSEASVMEIALKYGFSSHESYTRAFSKIVGMTPRDFRKKRPVVGKEELTPGIYGIGFLGKMEQRSDISMEKKKYADAGSTILYGVPKVEWGAFGGNTPWPICLKACSDYLGEDVSYAYSMVSTGAAFRLTWNTEKWDMSNVDIYHTLEESGEIYRIGVEALGREFDFQKRDATTEKEEFVSFIKRHLDEGYPCIAQGIIGPPEPCLITGYRNNGKTLLGWNFFQDDPDFGASVKKDGSGYFICDNWWENADTQGVMCMGPIAKKPFSQKKILENAVRVMTGRKENAYAKGIWAYDAWEKMLGDDSSFSGSGNTGGLFEKMLCQWDAMNSIIDGRESAAKYFVDTPILAKTFSHTKEIMCEMREVLGGKENTETRLSKLKDAKIRKKTCSYIQLAKESDEKSLQEMKKLLGS